MFCCNQILFAFDVHGKCRASGLTILYPEYSMDDVNFHALEGAINLPIDKGILKSFHSTPFMRISYTANGATGAVTLNYNSSYQSVSNLGR